MPTIVTIGNTNGGLVNRAKAAINSTNNLLGQFDGLINGATSQDVKNKIVNYKNIAIQATKEQKWRIDAINSNTNKLTQQYGAVLGQISAFGRTKVQPQINEANRIVVDSTELTVAIENQNNIANQAYQDALKANSDNDRLVREAAERERLAREAAERERLAREAAERERLAREAAERERLAREAAERERLAREAAERERLAREAAERAAREKAEREAAEAAARARAKADAKAAWDAAQVVANAALAAWEKQKTDYTTAINAIPPLKLVYDNAQMAVDNTKLKKDAYDDAIAQQTTANALFKSATDALSKANGKAQENIEKTFAQDSTFVKNAALFPNLDFGIDKEYNAMMIDWAAYGTAKTELSKIDASKVADITAATAKLMENYTKFGTSKGVYSAAVINAMKANNTEIEYIKNNKNNADTYEAVYGLTKEYKAMADAWKKVTTSVGESDTLGVINNYNAYLLTKKAFVNALLVAQNKRSEALFQSKLIAGRDASKNWMKNAEKGCRNIQTTASTDPDMLDQDIACNDTEFISGYTKISGFDAAPVDPNVTKDNIAQYLAVKYSCCTAPSGTKGPKGKKGLPGLDGAPGPIGPAGPDGREGPVGIRGQPGEIGPDGGNGPRGETGDDGQDGEVGLPGAPGKSVKAPAVKQVPGPMGQDGEVGPRGQQGPKGPNGSVILAPVTGFSELDRTIALLNVKGKINTYLRG